MYPMERSIMACPECLDEVYLCEVCKDAFTPHSEMVCINDGLLQKHVHKDCMEVESHGVETTGAQEVR